MERMIEDNSLRTLVTGMVHVSRVELWSSDHQPRFSCDGIVPASRIEDALKNVEELTENKTGRTFYRMGEEFMTEEALSIVSQRHPDEEVRNEAKMILENSVPNRT